MINEEVIKEAVSEAYNRGYKQGREDVKGMVISAFDIWDKALEKSSLHVSEDHDA